MSRALRPIVLLTLLGLALRAFHMNAQSLWFDEIGSARTATTPLADLTRAVETGSASVEPSTWLSPAYYAIAKAALWLPHASPDALLRATSVVLGTATIPALAWTAAAILPAHAVTMTTAALAFSPFHVWYSQEVRPYVLLVLLVALFLGALLRALESNRASWWALVAVVTSLALYTHPIALGLLPIAAIGIVTAAIGRPRRALPGLAALAAVGIAFLPAVLSIGRFGANHPADLRPVGWLDLPYAFYAYAVGFSLGPSTTELHAGTIAPLVPYLGVVAAAALVFGMIVYRGLLASLRLPIVSMVVLWSALVVPIALALVIAINSANPFNVRYAIVSFPSFVVLVGLGLAERRPLARPLAIAALAIASVSLANLYFDPHYAKEDCRGLGRALAAEADADDLVVVNAGYMASAVSYYYPGPATVVGYPPPAVTGPLDPAATAADLARLTAGRRHVWLISTRTFHGDKAGTLPAVLATTRTVDRTLEFHGVDARRFSPR